MFTLCMSRGHPPLKDANSDKGVTIKQVKGGYLRRYRRGFFYNDWSEEWFVLYEDSTLAWFRDKGLGRPRGRVRLSDSPDLVAVGEWTRQVPKKPRLYRHIDIGRLLVIGTRMPHHVHWLLAQSPADVNDWMTAISNTLPPPPHLPLQNKRLSLTSSNKAAMISTSYCQDCTPSSILPKKTYRNYDEEHTVLPGVVIDWGHGWGWGQAACAAHTACLMDTSTLYCHSMVDYAAVGCEDADWCAIADFAF